MFDLGAPVLIADRLTGEYKRRIYESVCVTIYLNSYFHYNGVKNGVHGAEKLSHIVC